MPKEDEFETGGHRYRTTGKLNAVKQLHVVRRLAPLMASFAGIDLQGLRPETQQTDPARAEQAMASMVGPLTEGVAKLSDEDTEYVLGTCLELVQRRLDGGTGWAATWSHNAKALMYDDVTLIDLFTMVAHVLMANVGDFGFALRRTGEQAATVRLTE